MTAKPRRSAKSTPQERQVITVAIELTRTEGEPVDWESVAEEIRLWLEEEGQLHAKTANGIYVEETRHEINEVRTVSIESEWPS